MNIVISAYTKKAFCEILLPAVNNTDTEILLKKNIFDYANDVILKLEVVNREWFLKCTDEYFYTIEKGIVGKSLKDGDIITVHRKQGEIISLIVREVENSFSVFQKYDISSLESISIGSEENNDIVYQTLALVSRHHATLRRVQHGFCVEDTSSNGTFVNDKRVTGTSALQVGDCINIFGLKIVYLEDMIAVHSSEDEACTVCQRLPGYVGHPAEKANRTEHTKEREKHYFHRAPRNYIKLDTGTIEIEAPPSPKEENKKPLWMTIGPSFTMMIPMLIGSVMAIISANSEGRNAGVYMYAGMITAVASALIGVFWLLANMNFGKKEVRRAEEKRFQVYGSYLVKRAGLIREKYEASRDALLGMYPAASVVARYGAGSIELWNRNSMHGDFLYQRIGIGNLLFQMAIQVPREHFTLISDELAEKPRRIQEEFSTLYDVPVNVDLLTHRLIGIVGGEKKKGAYEILRPLVTQIAASNCYTDVKLVFIYDENKDEENWEYARWLPHVWSEDRRSRYVASNKTEASDILFELTQILRMRAEKGQLKKETVPKPYYILVVSDIELLEGELIMKYIQEGESCYGLTTLILSESREQLPNMCEYILQRDDDYNGIYHLRQEEEYALIFDEISSTQLEEFARRLLPVEVKEMEKGSDIPGYLSFLEMHHVRKLEELNVKEKWLKNRTYENMRALIGVKAGSMPCYLDVHEKYHGPHGLVAGTTGSGKSETLQTYLLSLAINFSPEDVGFFIIDYKGGGMAGLFQGLPHMVGSISNLSGSQVRRAMVSIKSENHRRQRVFAENNVNNINSYTKLYKNGEAVIPVPHLFVIIDEFAELKREEPEFMKEIISVAQVGRSLGVHLILATQKPSGTVDENIWSNAKFHLCLRVQDRQDSNDMLHKPDAAYITQTGRGYLQVGNDEVYELFQSGYSGVPYEDTGDANQPEIASMLSLAGKADLVGSSLERRRQGQIQKKWIQNILSVMKAAGEGSIYALSEKINWVSLFFEEAERQKLEYPDTAYNRQRIEDLMEIYMEACTALNDFLPEKEAERVIWNANSQHRKLPEARRMSQLEAVVEYLGKIAREEGYPGQMQLWLPLLPDRIYLHELQGRTNGSFYTGYWLRQESEWRLSTPVGLYDDPVNQAQNPLIVDFGKDGHLAVCGTITSGKSCFLQTILYGLVNSYPPDWLNLYILDFSSRMHICMAQAPHVGGILYEEDTEKIDRFFHMMERMIEERKRLLGGSNYAQYAQIHGITIPAVVIAIDEFGSFREKTDNRYDDKVLRLAKEGMGCGIYLVITAMGFVSTEIFPKFGDHFKTVICLQMNDKFAYMDAFRTSVIEVLPESNVKGRGLAVVGEDILEFQTALAMEAEDDYSRMEKVDHACGLMRESWDGHLARKIPVIPERPVWSEYEQLDEVQDMWKRGTHLPIGYDMASADVYGIDLVRTYSYLVSGRARTGKTNLLKAILRSAASMDGKAVVIEHGAEDLRAVALAAGAEYIAGQEAQAEFFSSLVEPFRQRNALKRRLMGEGKDEAEIFTAMQEEIPYFIIVSDILPFVLSIVEPEEQVLKIKAFVENIAEKGKSHRIYFFLGINPDTVHVVQNTKIFESLTGYHAGIHLGGNMKNVRYLDFSNIPYLEQEKTQKAGIGMIPASNEEEVEKVVIPFVKA